MRIEAEHTAIDGAHHDHAISLNRPGQHFRRHARNPYRRAAVIHEGMDFAVLGAEQNQVAGDARPSAEGQLGLDLPQLLAAARVDRCQNALVVGNEMRPFE